MGLSHLDAEGVIWFSSLYECTAESQSATKKPHKTRKGGESNAKMHLVLTPDVFALRLDAAIFAYHIEKIMLKASENRKFRASKKPNVGFFAQGLRQ